MKVKLLILTLLAALVVGVTAAAASTIVGTNGPDRLQGTAFADRIDGKGRRRRDLRPCRRRRPGRRRRERLDLDRRGPRLRKRRPR
ncbi:MAG: hypothetical protein ACXVZ2_05845 [Gaiellaceae bacterium]